MDISATPQMWALFGGLVLAALAIDFFALNRQGAHAVSMREAPSATRWRLAGHWHTSNIANLL